MHFVGLVYWWRRGRINEIILRRVLLLLGWMKVGRRVYHLIYLFLILHCHTKEYAVDNKQ